MSLMLGRDVSIDNFTAACELLFDPVLKIYEEDYIKCTDLPGGHDELSNKFFSKPRNYA